MFKKTKIAAATVALLSAAAMQNASAVAIDDSGTNAQVLIFPYYNTNNGFATGFAVRNTTGATKAVKFRFRESKLSNDVLDFNVYLSPYDRVSFGLTVNAAGQASIATNDTTCIHPAIVGSVPLKGNVYKATKDADGREGYLEVIEMGVVDPNATVTGAGPSGTSTVKIVDGIKHTTASVPFDCSVIAKAWAQGKFTPGGANSVLGGVNDIGRTPLNISAPTGGLQGWSFLLDFDNGNAFVAMPAAIRNYQSGVHGQHYRSSDAAAFLLPSLASGDSTTSVVMNNAGTASISTAWNTTADYAATPTGAKEVVLGNGNAGPASSGINPLPMAHVLAATGFSNDYNVTATTNAGTDWVITFPMRKHGIFSNVAYTTPTTFDGPTDSDVKISGSSAFYNSEEQTAAVSDDFSPVSTSPSELLPREVNVLSFGKTGGTVLKVLNSSFFKNYGVSYNEGWGNVVFGLQTVPASLGLPTATTTVPGTPETVITNAFTAKSKGVPVIGFAAFRGEFGAGGKVNSISESVPHVFTRDTAPVNQ